MPTTYLKLFLVGCVLAIGFIGSYLIYRKRLSPQLWWQTSLKALAIGVGLSFITCLGTSLFLLLVVLCIAAIVYFADAAQQDEKVEYMLVATLGGLLIGLINLASMLLCC
jgi:multisubunit Na+/H+ antiporter MnhB subunit